MKARHAVVAVLGASVMAAGIGGAAFGSNNKVACRTNGSSQCKCDNNSIVVRGRNSRVHGNVVSTNCSTQPAGGDADRRGDDDRRRGPDASTAAEPTARSGDDRVVLTLRQFRALCRAADQPRICERLLR